MATSDWLRLLLLSLLWGCAFFFIEIALEDSGPLTIVLVRVGGAGLALLIYCLARGIPIGLEPRTFGQIAMLAVVACALPFTLIATGQIWITSGLTAILIASTPFFTVLLGHLWGRMEPATPTKIGGVLIGMLGVAILMGSDVLTGLSGTLPGQLAVLAAAFSYAIGALYGRRFRDIRPSLISTWMLIFAALMLAPLAFLFETPFDPLPDVPALAALAALALLSTALAFLLYFRILASAGATNAMLVTFVQPPVAILLGVLFLKEAFLPHHFAGMVLIFVGLALVDGRVVRLVMSRS
ncbi:MAG: DMT family transporter [Pseudomonadota bacterium]